MTDDRKLIADYRAARAEQARAESALVDAQIQAGFRQAPRRWPLRAAVIVLVGALVFAGFGVASWLRSRDNYSDADYRAAASSRVQLLLSPDYREPTAVKQILASATGRFYDEFAQSADAYTTFVTKQGTVSHGQVTGAGVSRRLGDDAEVLVAARIDLAAQPDRPAASSDVRLRVIVTPENGALKLSMVQYLP